MKNDHDWKILVHVWHRLTPFQRRKLILLARLWEAEKRLYYTILYIAILGSRMLVPIPPAIIERVTISKDLKIKIHWRGED